MKKLLMTSVLSCLTTSVLAFNAEAQTYCENGAGSAHYFWIESVASGDFFHTAGPLQGVLDDQDHLYHGYLDYTDLMINWKTETNPLELTPGTLIPGYPMSWQVWLDLNLDYDFSPDELVLSAQSLTAVTQSVDLSGLNISSDLITRMRVSMSFIEPAPVCGGFGMGEVEDYSVTIQAPTHFSLRVPEDYTSIQAAIDAALPGDRVLVNDGTYYETLVVNKPLLLESVNGFETTLVVGVANQHTIEVQSADVAIKGFDVAGASANQKAGIYFAQGAHNGEAKYNRCADIVAVDPSYAGVYVDDADFVVVNDQLCEAPGTFGVRVDDSIGSHVSNNTANNQTGAGFYIYRSSDVIVENNQARNNQLAGININKLVNGLVTANECSDNIDTEAHFRGGKGISVIYSDGLNITDNQCIDNDGVGISVRLSDDVVVSGNTSNENEMGIHAGAAHRISIINNFSNNNLNEGVLVASSNDVLVNGNEVLFNVSHGLHLTRSNHAEVTDNQLLSNGRAFNIRESNQGVFVGNSLQSPEVVEPDCQMLLYRSSGNRFFLNNFNMAFDSVWCVDQDSVNQWQTSGPVDYIYLSQTLTGYLGNFYLGVSHSDTGGDGVADQVLVLPGNQQSDGFALVAPAGDYRVQ